MASLQISIRRDLYNKLKQLKHANRKFFRRYRTIITT